jgi:hypothetical protein
LTAKDRRRIRGRKEVLDGEHRVWDGLDVRRAIGGEQHCGF